MQGGITARPLDYFGVLVAVSVLAVGLSRQRGVPIQADTLFATILTHLRNKSKASEVFVAIVRTWGKHMFVEEAIGNRRATNRGVAEQESRKPDSTGRGRGK